jgi:hypothetical protein
MSDPHTPNNPPNPHGLDPLEEALRRERELLDAHPDTSSELDVAMPRADLWAGIAAGLDADQQAGRSSASGEGAETHQANQSEIQPETGSEAGAESKPTTIERQLHQTAPAWQGWLRVAAVLAVVLAAGLWLSRDAVGPGSNSSPSSGGGIIANGSHSASSLGELPDVPESAQRDPSFVELQKVATQYARMADRNENRILENPALGPEESEIAVAFLADLENDYRELLDDWAEGADPDKVLQAMVRNYRQRIELLEHLSNILEPEQAPQNDTRYEDAVVL